MHAHTQLNNLQGGPSCCLGPDSRRCNWGQTQQHVAVTLVSPPTQSPHREACTGCTEEGTPACLSVCLHVHRNRQADITRYPSTTNQRQHPDTHKQQHNFCLSLSRHSASSQAAKYNCEQHTERRHKRFFPAHTRYVPAWVCRQERVHKARPTACKLAGAPAHIALGEIQRLLQHTP